MDKAITVLSGRQHEYTCRLVLFGADDEGGCSCQTPFPLPVIQAEPTRTAKDITMRELIRAHETIAIANGAYTAIAMRDCRPIDAAICARLSFHHANSFRSLTNWISHSKFVRLDEPCV